MGPTAGQIAVSLAKEHGATAEELEIFDDVGEFLDRHSEFASLSDHDRQQAVMHVVLAMIDDDADPVDVVRRYAAMIVSGTSGRHIDDPGAVAIALRAVTRG